MREGRDAAVRGVNCRSNTAIAASGTESERCVFWGEAMTIPNTFPTDGSCQRLRGESVMNIHRNDVKFGGWAQAPLADRAS